MNPKASATTTDLNKLLRITLRTTGWLSRVLFKTALAIGSFFLALYFGVRSKHRKNNDAPSRDIEGHAFVGDDRTGLFAPKE